MSAPEEAGLGLRTRPESCLSDFAIERSLIGELAVPAERAGMITAGGRAKGGGLVLEVMARHADGRVSPVFDGTTLRPGDAVRFQLTAPVAGHAALLGLDGAGHVSLYAPAASEATLPVAAG